MAIDYRFSLVRLDTPLHGRATQTSERVLNDMTQTLNVGAMDIGINAVNLETYCGSVRLYKLLPRTWFVTRDACMECNLK